jgi:AraC-like DNA-binding protein
MRIPAELSHRHVWSSPNARRLLWHVFSIGAGPVRERQHGPSHGKPGANLVWIESGRGELILGSRRVELRPSNTFLLYGPEQDRVFIPGTGQQLITNHVRFGGPNLELWLDKLDVARNPEFRLAHADRIRACHRQLAHVIARREADWEWEVHVRLTALLKPFLIARGLLAPSEELPLPVTRVMDVIAADPARDWQVSELANHAGLSESRLRTLFRTSLRETIHQHIQRVRLNLARELLRDSRLRIREIAERLHFSDEYYFSKFFRHSTGWSPTEYREQLSRK